MSHKTQTPLYIKISDMIAREIQTGILLNGDKLPPERHLAAQLSVSVGTLRKALLELESKDMLTRIHGSGNYVHKLVDNEIACPLIRLQPINGEATHHARLLSLDKLSKPADLPKLGTSDNVYRFRRQRMMGTKRTAIEEIWLDASYADSIEPEDVGESMYNFYKQTLGFWITQAEDRVSLSTKPAWAPAQWPRVDKGFCGYIERLSKDNADQFAEYARIWFDPTIVQFVSHSESTKKIGFTLPQAKGNSQG